MRNLKISENKWWWSTKKFIVQNSSFDGKRGSLIYRRAAWYTDARCCHVYNIETELRACWPHTELITCILHRLHESVWWGVGGRALVQFYWHRRWRYKSITQSTTNNEFFTPHSSVIWDRLHDAILFPAHHGPSRNATKPFISWASLAIPNTAATLVFSTPPACTTGQWCSCPGTQASTHARTHARVTRLSSINRLAGQVLVHANEVDDMETRLGQANLQARSRWIDNSVTTVSSSLLQKTDLDGTSDWRVEVEVVVHCVRTWQHAGTRSNAN